MIVLFQTTSLRNMSISNSTKTLLASYHGIAHVDPGFICDNAPSSYYNVESLEKAKEECQRIAEAHSSSPTNRFIVIVDIVSLINAFQVGRAHCIKQSFDR